MDFLHKVSGVQCSFDCVDFQNIFVSLWFEQLEGKQTMTEFNS